MSEFHVYRDGIHKAGPMTANEAFEFVHAIQGQSVDWATTHEGWEIREVEKEVENA
jgi:hypothetical protein